MKSDIIMDDGKVWSVRDRYGNDGHPEPNNYIVTAYQKQIG